MKKNVLLLLSVFSIGLSGCASIMDGAWQPVAFSSSPSGARIYLDGIEIGTTPMIYDLHRRGYMPHRGLKKSFYQVEIVLDGFYPYEMVINRTINEWVFGNLLLGGIIGIAIDAGTGAMYKLTPDQIVCNLNRSVANVEHQKDQLYIAVVLEPDPAWEQIGALTPTGE
ncbi:PEGA domain-containing protein [Pontibacter sp. G13]|uniref:PEGA domain-containing protein n=1 Tax=Pontibacter sp. G13 TaxID=3074898 RepID=UPI00288AD466|nr:PEGA domain-containing protein [Pontibacter sp. G13]WNJ20329.1 PEGA domain-containing protein [Pontibacter sp. G13]